MYRTKTSFASNSLKTDNILHYIIYSERQEKTESEIEDPSLYGHKGNSRNGLDSREVMVHEDIYIKYINIFISYIRSEQNAAIKPCSMQAIAT